MFDSARVDDVSVKANLGYVILEVDRVIEQAGHATSLRLLDFGDRARTLSVGQSKTILARDSKKSHKLIEWNFLRNLCHFLRNYLQMQITFCGSCFNSCSCRQDGL